MPQTACKCHLGILRPVRIIKWKGGRQLQSISPSDTVNIQRRVFQTKAFLRHVFKKRVAIQGRGKSGGARVLVGANLGSRWFFVFGFEKNERANIKDRELAVLQKLAAVLLKLDADRIAIELELGNLTEICREAKPNTH